jgi:hypothetical protein
MKKINVIDFYQMGNWLGYLRLIKAGKPTDETYNYLYKAQQWLEVVCKHPANIVQLDLSKPAARSLLDAVTAVLSRLLITQIGSDVTPDDVGKITVGLARFELILLEELRSLATYYVSQKRNYSTQGLIEHADNELPDFVKPRLSAQTITDIKSAGKAIAFELGTAAGIHAFRALESVALDYVNKRGLSPSRRDLWSYFDALQKDGADPKAIQVGQQLRELRRNPLAHPADNLDVDEAIEAFQLCTSAITALVRDMEKRNLFPA